MKIQSKVERPLLNPFSSSHMSVSAIVSTFIANIFSQAYILYSESNKLIPLITVTAFTFLKNRFNNCIIVVVVVVVVVVVINAQALEGIPFTFYHPSIILQLMEYYQCLKLCILEGDFDSLQSFLLYIRHTLGIEKATICINELPNNHGR
jgi:hypothetical protein